MHAYHSLSVCPAQSQWRGYVNTLSSCHLHLPGRIRFRQGFVFGVFPCRFSRLFVLQPLTPIHSFGKVRLVIRLALLFSTKIYVTRNLEEFQLSDHCPPPSSRLSSNLGTARVSQSSSINGDMVRFSFIAAGTFAANVMAQASPAHFVNTTWNKVHVGQIWPIQWSPGDGSPVSLFLVNSTWIMNIFGRLDFGLPKCLLPY